MAATIQTIQTPKRARALDTSGNNNHGQIYSGRALEFDGVSDHLNTGQSFSSLITESHTLSAWINTDRVTGGAQAFLGTVTQWTGYNYFRVDDDGILRYTIGTNSAKEHTGATATNTVRIGTWYHVVATFNKSSATAGTITLYMNGVSVVSDSTPTHDGDWNTDNYVNNYTLYVGARNNANTAEQFFAGKIANVQIWDAVWSADDVMYAYLNPEQLALNRGGTSLTNSNLRAWYPMQDGHRGQQSFVLDGSNVGVGRELVTNGDCSTDSFTKESNWAYDSTNQRYNSTVTNANGIYQNVGIVAYKNYEVTFTVSNYSSGAVQANVGSYAAGGGTVRTGNGTYTETINANHGSSNANVYIMGHNASGGFTGSVDDISCKPINDKNHATTVFYGDELHTVETCTSPTNQTDEVDEWTNAGFATFASDTKGDEPTAQGTHSLHLISDGDGDYCKLASPITIVAGRQYQFQTTYFGGGADNEFQIRFSPSDDNVTGYGSNTISTAAWTTTTGTFTATGTTLYVRIYEFSSDNVGEIYIGSLSIKEIGTATGWTDADQQLDIPQTALQSYNHLAWFDGTNDYVSLGAQAAPDAASITISAWVNINASGGNVVTWGETMLEATTSTVNMYVNVGAGGSSNRLEISTALVTAGVWHHVVVTRGSDNKGNLYIDGAFVAEEVDHDLDAIATNDEGSAIGARSDGASTHFDGAITEVSIWNDTFTLAEVQELYNDGKALDATTHSAKTNIVGYWRNNGLAVWQDLTTNDNDGTPTNFTETLLIPAGVDGSRDNQGFLMNRQKDTNALNLTGAEYVDAGDSATLDITSAITLEAWFKKDDTTNIGELISRRDASNANYDLIAWSDGNIYFEMWISGAVKQVQVSYTANTWYHVVGTYDGSNQKLYLDGSLVDNDAETGSIDNDDVSLTIGAMEDGASYTFGGSIDDVKIYSKALTLAEVERNYNAGKRSHR